MLDIHVISHTHWDREWYLTHEQFRLRLVALIDRLLDLLERDRSFKYFHLDGQTIVLEDYLEMRPEQESRLRAAIQSGRILIGPWYVMPDEFLVSAESLVRNLLRGHSISRQFGSPMPVGYLPDLFGHVGQMPQIWRQVGLDNTILWRGFDGPYAEYWWQAPDGSRVLMMHLPPEGYCNATRIVFDPDAMMARAAEKVGYERARTRTGQALLMNGVDHVEPHTGVPALIERLSSVGGQRARHSTLPDYVAAVREAVTSQRLQLETVVGELRGGVDYANLLPGVLSARVYLKQQNALVQTLLESYAEPFSVFAWRLGSRYPAGELRYAWKTLLQNHPHDSICGCSIDAVHEENVTRFARARQVASALAESALDAVADTVPCPPAGAIRALAVNADAVARSQVIDAVIDLPIDTAEPCRHVDTQALDRPVRFWSPADTIVGVADAHGKPVAFQILREERAVHHEMSRFETPWALNVRRLHVAVWADAVPPCGYTAFDFIIGPARPERTDPPSAAPATCENGYVLLSANADGTFQLTDKSTGIVYRNVAAFEDVADVGDEYNYCPPANDRRVCNRDARLVSARVLTSGPLRTTLRVELEVAVPASASTDRSGRSADTVAIPVTIDASVDMESPRVGFKVSVDNRARDHRLRLLFPTAASRIESARADSVFDVVSRPARQAVPAVIKNEAPVSSAPMISFVSAGDARAGATVIGKGLMEYEILDTEPTIAVTLLRAVGDLSRGDLATRPSGQAGPPVATPGAQCIGAHAFELAFQPHAAPPSNAALIAAARAHNVQPGVVIARLGNGTAPLQRSFVRIDASAGNVVLSAIKQAEERPTTIVRLFNPGDVVADAVLSLDAPIARAFAVNLLEERQRELMLTDEGIVLQLGPREIQTIEVLAE
jgi:alpha-mannosidase